MDSITALFTPHAPHRTESSADDTPNDDDSYSSPPTSDEYNIYFGYLHSHTGVSDGEGTPEDAYSQAKEKGLDFFGTSDHDYYPNDMTIESWEYINRVADSYNEDGVFTALVGFEWTSDEAWEVETPDDPISGPGHNYGHFTVTGTPSWCNSRLANCDTLGEFVKWLDSQPTGLAIFNHPGQYDSNAFNKLDFTKSEHIIGMELWNRDKEYYTKRGADGVRYYDEALQKGWRIGAGGGQDNHSDDWATKNKSRMAVLAKSLSRSDIMEALEARRFYSTLIDGVALSFQCNGQDMGSVVLVEGDGTGAHHTCTVDVTSAHIFTWIELVHNGDEVVSIENPSFPLTSSIDADTINGNEYIYAVLYQGCDWKVVTSPIFFEAEELK